ARQYSGSRRRTPSVVEGAAALPVHREILADGGYQGPKMARIMLRLATGGFRSSNDPGAKGFVVLPKRWIVSRRTILPTSAPSSGPLPSFERLRGAVPAG